MTNSLVSTKGLVKVVAERCDDFLSHPHDPGFVAKADETGPQIDGLGDRIKRLRESKGWSQRELSKQAKLKSETHVGIIERGNAAKFPALRAIAQALGVDVSDLTGEQTSRAEPSLELDAQYPERSTAAQIERLTEPGDETEEVIARVCADYRGSRDMPRRDWLVQFAAMRATIRSERKDSGSLVERPRPADPLAELEAADRSRQKRPKK
jgi:transcriptional regulator with XRE-family HTH domain